MTDVITLGNECTELQSIMIRVMLFLEHNGNNHNNHLIWGPILYPHIISLYVHYNTCKQVIVPEIII